MSRFSGKLVLVLLDDKDHPSLRKGRSLWGVERVLSYRTSVGGRDSVITVPRGYVTDLASIPRPFWSGLPADGPWAKAAVVHDVLCSSQGGRKLLLGHKVIDRDTPFTSAEAADVLREACADRGVSLAQRNIIWSAVRVGGPRF